MFKHLLVPLDGSELAESVLPVALEVAKQFGSELTLLRVVCPPHFMGSANDFAELYVSLLEDMRQEAEAYLQIKQQALHDAGFKVNGRVLEGASVADYILDAADAWGVDAIAMSTHGRGGLKRWVYGSVADKVLRYGRVPILLVRSEAAEETKPLPVPTIENLADIRSHRDALDLADTEL